MSRSAKSQIMPLALSPMSPTQAQRVASRKALIAMSRRRQRPGSGSMLEDLLRTRGMTMEWWLTISNRLARNGVPNAVAGAIASNAYMPPRHTADFDLMIELEKLTIANEILSVDEWEHIGDLDLYEGLEGTAWKGLSDESRLVDIIGLPDEWGRTAIATAQDNVVGGIPTLTLPFLVITKLISSRAQDTADLSRALGAADDAARERVLVAVRHYRPSDADDVEQLIELGKLEFGR
ncbi:MAG: hypothetical protein ACR2H0_08590 [Candidatus Limnocylindrales bacterium]